MRTTVWPLLLVLTPTLCAQTEPPPPPFVPMVAVDPSHLPKPGETVSTRALLIPPKAMKELQRSQGAFLSGDILSSARHLERALQIYPHYLEAHNNLGSRYIELHEYEKAAAEFQKAIDLDSRVMQPFNNLSVALFLLQHYPDAEIAARRALDLDPHNSTAQYMLGCVLATEKRNPSEAMELLRQTEIEFPDARLLLAQILLRQGAVNEAKKELHEYLKVPGVEKKQKVECWLARLEQTSATQKDSFTSLAELEARATSGDPAPQLQLAFHLFQTGRPPNYPLILNLLRSSTAQHYAAAQYMLGYLYENASGLPRDYTKAAENYRAAALQGYVAAQNNLANLYYTGHGVHKDPGSAFEWYHSAAEHGDANAERNFGYLYYQGEGTRRDYAEGARWFRAAAEQGDCQSEHALGYLYYKGLGVPIDYKEAARWKGLAAQQGDPHAQVDLGFLYESGQGVPLDYVTAYLWYSRAMAGGVKVAAERRKSLTHILTAEQLEQAQALVRTDTTHPQTSRAQSRPSASTDLVQNH